MDIPEDNNAGQCNCLEPIVDFDTQIIILGTMPGIASIEKEEYYANEDNVFWDIIYRVFNPPLPADRQILLSYREKLQVLKTNRIGLWDTLSACNRKGNQDHRISGEKINDFERFFSEHNQIHTIIFNGKKSLDYFRGKYPNLLKTINYRVWYSTSSSSPINAFYILYQWSELKTLLM
ncbi:hypoxanthine-DNA glycosylase [Pedobacter steynii]|uniref:Hypoxanthine-DNA glycosylase n=1 Tax=Pedobacter steynii TaxID=430522 RepID=A0A1G9LFD1_9SPHI|nr:DNA-deoxyinosine glycosylase [Pedobacter steynii]NQX38830.1 DNA-deoxyinosine glycosylase [Pedobacter steynii]SDL60574.1 hypoxanthine-DNA glycosylase [Pedobacter steynii]